MEVSFIHMQILVHLHVNKTNFHMKGLTLGLALKLRRKATRKSPILLTVKFIIIIMIISSHKNDPDIASTHEQN